MQQDKELVLIIGYHSINLEVLDYLESRGRIATVDSVREFSESILENMTNCLFNDGTFSGFFISIKVDMRYKRALVDGMAERRLIDIEFEPSFFEPAKARSFNFLRNTFNGWAKTFIDNFLSDKLAIKTSKFSKDT